MPDLSWHYGPTEADPDPGGMWHYDCGGRVGWIKTGPGEGGHICECGAQDTRTRAEVHEEIHSGWWKGGWSSGHAAQEFHEIAERLVAAGLDPLDVVKLLNRARLAVAHEYGD